MMRVVLLCGILFLLFPCSLQADTIQRTVSGYSDGGQAVSFIVTVNFTATGGDFSAGTGTATVEFILENTSGLFPFQSPPMGNPILTGFMFNIPEGATIALTEGRILAGSVLYSTGTTMPDGYYLPPGCMVLSEDAIHTGWYELTYDEAAGHYGIFTNSIETEEGVKGGFVDPEVIPSCTLMGDVFSPAVVAGIVKFTLELGNLDETLDSAEDFLRLCSHIHGKQQESAFGGKFQATDEYGEGSGFVADVGYCGEVSNERSSWGAIKSIYK